MSLIEELRNLRDELRKKMPGPALAVFLKAAADLAKSGILDRCVKVGDKAPDFDLLGASGNRVQLYNLLGRGPVVVSFFRGSW